MSASYPAGLLRPLPIPQDTWIDLSIDFIKSLPISNGFLVIMVVVDRLFKYSHFMPLKHPFTAVTVAIIFFDNVFNLYGMPLSIDTDQGSIFVSYF